MISCGIAKATNLNKNKLLIKGYDKNGLKTIDIQRFLNLCIKGIIENEMGSKLPKHIEQKQMESFLRLLL